MAVDHLVDLEKVWMLFSRDVLDLFTSSATPARGRILVCSSVYLCVQDAYRTARAKGLSARHALAQALMGAD